MTRHLKFPAARNSLYNTKDINNCLLQLSLRKGYVEGGLANLSLRSNLPNTVSTGRTFRKRVERVEAREIRRTLTHANDDVLRALNGFGIFKRRTVVAIDYNRKHFYGDPNLNMIVGGPYECALAPSLCHEPP